MNRLPFALLALLATAAAPPARPTPGDIIAAAPRSAWTAIPAEDLLVIDFDGGGRTIIQLAPAFAPVHVANLRALAGAGYWRGAGVYRVQDNYVAQWGVNDDGKPLPAGVVKRPPAEYTRPLKGLSPRPFPFADPYAPRVGHALGWPVAWNPATGRASLTHCYGTVGVGRDLSPDTGTGGELYAVIGHGPRHLDRNIAVVGRVIEGIENLSALPRGTEALGMYPKTMKPKGIADVRLASALAAGERPAFEVMKEGSASFTRYLAVRANRHDAFYNVPAGGVDLCNAPVPVRRTPAPQ
jgi:peptidylprolyl isomerase